MTPGITTATVPALQIPAVSNDTSRPGGTRPAPPVFEAPQGDLGIATAVAAARGQTVEPNVDTGTAMVTKDNVGQF